MDVLEVCHHSGDDHDPSLTQARLVEQRPLWIRGLARDWPSVGRWTLSWLCHHFPESVVRVYVSSEQGVLGQGPHMVPLKDVEGMRATHKDVFVANTRARDIDASLVGGVCRPFGGDIGGDEGNLWVGGAGHVSHMHYDSHPGILVTLCGHKRVLLFGPHRAELSARNDKHYNHVSTDGPTSVAPDCVIDLREGDALLIPLYWWHEVHSVTDSTAINFWYYPLPECVNAKWEDPVLFQVTRREVERLVREMVPKLPSKWALIREDVLKQIYVSMARGGADPLAQYEDHKPKVVQVVQEMLMTL